jgi:hypothetical protein
MFYVSFFRMFEPNFHEVAMPSFTFLTSAYITKTVTTKLVLQFIYLRKIENTNHPNGHGR